jgi:hypothetical protein
MADHQAVDDMLTELIGHVAQTVRRIEELSGQEWRYVFAATPIADDGMTDSRITLRETDDVQSDLAHWGASLLRHAKAHRKAR